MKKIHTLKIEKNFYLSKICGVKMFELRNNDRMFESGDFVHYVDIDGQEFPEDNKNLYEILYVLSDYKGLQDGYVIFGERRVLNGKR